MSIQATCAPSRANSTLIARPLPIGGASSTILRCPAPTTMIFRPASRPRPGASPSVSGCSEADGSSCRGACVVVDMAACSLCFSSWPGLTRPSTSFDRQRKQVVDARVKPGHDDLFDGLFHPEKIPFSQLDAVVPQNGVGDRGVEIEVRKRKGRKELLALQRQLVVRPGREGDVA